MTTPLLEVNHLSLTLQSSSHRFKLLHDITFNIYPGEIVGLMGESGCGKSLTASAIFNLLPSTHQLSGSIRFEGQEILNQRDDPLSHLRGHRLSLILQDPVLALNPIIPIGRQLTEGLRYHKKLSQREAFVKGIEWLTRVGIGEASYRMHQYPHELSGGMKQRVLIAMALICQPSLLIADEPTTALDVTVQAQILDLLRHLQQEEKISLLLITHDLGVIAHCCQRVLVMHAGQLVETGSVEKVLTTPQHPYTQVRNMTPLLDIRHLSKQFPLGRQTVSAVQDVSFSLGVGEILGLGGESGCGKSTLSKLIMRLIEPTAGSIFFEGQELTALPSRGAQAWRRKIQMIFQHPSASLNPRFTVEKTLAEPLIIHDLAKGAERSKRLAALLSQVGLSEDYLNRLPHELSGGQKQRVAIARALAVEPRLLICDEPFSGLDASIQAQLVNLFIRLHREHHLSYLVISHDLSILRSMTHRLAIMYAGQLVEWGPSLEVYHRPLHPYSQTLVSAVLSANPFKRRLFSAHSLKREIPQVMQPSLGCPFYERCPLAQKVCREKRPAWREIKPQHFAACHQLS